jgi:hypothetical protein
MDTLPACSRSSPMNTLSPFVEPIELPIRRLFVRRKSLGVKFSCLIVSDGFPHWILALRPMDWSQVLWMQFDSAPVNLLPLLETFLSPLQDVLTTVPFEATHFAALSASVDILLCSGSEARLSQVFSNDRPLLIHRECCFESFAPGHALSSRLLASSMAPSHARWSYKRQPSYGLPAR